MRFCFYIGVTAELQVSRVQINDEGYHTVNPISLVSIISLIRRGYNHYFTSRDVGRVKSATSPTKKNTTVLMQHTVNTCRTASLMYITVNITNARLWGKCVFP